jgi:hypothetical protein
VSTCEVVSPNRRPAICSVLVGVICGVLLAGASASAATFNSSGLEGGFKLQGSHGYSISAVAYSEGSGQRERSKCLFIVKMKAPPTERLPASRQTQSRQISGRLGRSM